MKPKILLTSLFIILVIAGFAVRFTDVNDQPLDFNPSRQLFSAIIARAIYYETLPDADSQALALAQAHRETLEKLEPPIFESLIVLGYHLTGGENLWIARVFSIITWMLGAFVIHALGKRAGGSIGALVGVSYFLFLPLAIYASRSFQVDSTMIVLFAVSMLGLLKWSQRRSWTWAIVTGLVAGLAVFVKGYGAILMGPPMAAAVWAAFRQERESPFSTVKRILADRQVWAILLLTLGPTLLYYPALAGENNSLYTRSIFNRLDEVLSPSFFIRWMILLDHQLGMPVILAAFGSTWLAPKQVRGMLLGAWLGYALYGLTFPKLIITHDYYQLPLIMIVSVSLAPAVELVGKAIFRQGKLAQFAFAAAILLSAAFPGWIARSVLVSKDYRSTAAYWQSVSEAIPDDGRAIGYTQDYGFRLTYYGWRAIGILPEQISSKTFINEYSDADYFVVTSRSLMSNDLADYIEENYPVLVSGGGYKIYDLQP